MRYVIYGAGAIGGTIGARLFQAGHDVTLIARGAHLDSLRAGGLTFETPAGSETLRIPAAGSAEEARLQPGDVVVLAMKTQDTAAALESLTATATATATAGLRIVCAQNGVANERMALRRFEHVYGMCVMLPATHLEPGVVRASSSPVTGILDLGRYPSGADPAAEQIAADLEGATFSSRADPAILRRKYTKLLMNLGNSLDAACGREARQSDLGRRAREEGRACFAAAGIDAASDEEDRTRRGDLLQVTPGARSGSSSWQSLARATGSIEADYLNGEIVLLGRLHGVPTPVNALLQRVAGQMARERREPGTVPIDELLCELADLDAGGPPVSTPPNTGT
ncbi:MAG TPA: 2-dehydropantoate 2-reductase N-terminal domain-containing protein [Acidimicrobiales bacterium]|nr:2-dehydropantoate 2-reductase N-terminal domain-containing protein [Acidimicrobiales bacterium]